MPSMAQHSVRGIIVMIRTPFKQGLSEKQHEQHSQGDPREYRDIPRDFPGTPRQAQRRQPSTLLDEGHPRLAGLESAFGMEIAGTTAVAAPPPRPGQPHLHAGRGRPDELAKQMTHFGN